MVAKLAVAAALVLAAAGVGVPILVAHHDHERASTAERTPGDAVTTVRDLLDAALVRRDGQDACVYLTQPERERVGRAAGPGTLCREAVDAGALAFGAASLPRSPRQLRDLPAHVAPDENGYRVVVRIGSADVPFVLVPASPFQRDEFGAPDAAWRIDQGTVALLRQ